MFAKIIRQKKTSQNRYLIQLLHGVEIGRRVQYPKNKFDLFLTKSEMKSVVELQAVVRGWLVRRRKLNGGSVEKEESVLKVGMEVEDEEVEKKVEEEEKEEEVEKEEEKEDEKDKEKKSNELEKNFLESCKYIESVSKSLSNKEKLTVYVSLSSLSHDTHTHTHTRTNEFRYGLYKQSTEGPNNTKKPWSLGVAKYKWEAWKQCSELSKEEAKQAYVDFIGSLRGDDEKKKVDEEEKKKKVTENHQKTEFEIACEYAKNNVNSFSDKNKLKMYGLYKQATEGPNETKEPSMMKPVAKYKWKAWKQCSSLSREEATRAYVEFVGLLRGDDDRKVENVKEKKKVEENMVEQEKVVETVEEKTASPLEHHNHHHATTIQRHYRGYRFRSSHNHQLQHDHRYDLCRILLITDLSEECDDEVAFEVLVRGLAKVKDCNFVIELLVPDARERLQWFATVFEEHFRKGDWRWYVLCLSVCASIESCNCTGTSTKD